jgi:predicted porin
MKRNLLCAAMLAALGVSAQAQNVTPYGIIDLAIERLSNIGPQGDALWRMPGLTGSLPSRLGFRGVEDLGGGLRAVFTLEMGLALDTGSVNQGGRAWGRQSYLGLQGAWGSVTLGRQYTMLFWSQLDADLLGPNAYGPGSLDGYLANARHDNALAYRVTVGPVTAGASYSAGRDAVNAGPSLAGTNCPGESAADAKACQQWSAMVKFDRSAWGVSLAVDALRGGPGAFAGLTSSAMTDRRSAVAGYARWGDAKFGAGLIVRHNDASAATPRSRLWYLGAAYNMTASFVVDAQVSRLDYRNSANQATLLAARASYLLSRRTTVYTTAGRIMNDGALALSVSGAAPGGAPPAGGSQVGIAAGIRHTF